MKKSYATYEGWKRACKRIAKENMMTGVIIQGDKHIAEMFAYRELDEFSSKVFPLGEWDGCEGSIELGKPIEDVRIRENLIIHGKWSKI